MEIISANENEIIVKLKTSDAVAALFSRSFIHEKARLKPEQDNIEKLYQFFVNNQGRWVTGMDIYNANIVTRNQVKKFIELALPEVEKKVKSKGLTLIVERNGRGKKYKIS
jgi:hypothetical protein